MGILGLLNVLVYHDSADRNECSKLQQTNISINTFAHTHINTYTKYTIHTYIHTYRHTYIHAYQSVCEQRNGHVLEAYNSWLGHCAAPQSCQRNHESLVLKLAQCAW